MRETRIAFCVSHDLAEFSMPHPAEASDRWTFLTNHAHVLLCLSRAADMRLRDVAQQVGITERATQRIVADLVEAGYLGRARVGRRNHYQLHRELPFRHPVEQTKQIGALLDLFVA